METWIAEELEADELLWLVLSAPAVEADAAREELRRREDEAQEDAAERRRLN